MSDPIREKRLNDMALGDLEDALKALDIAVKNPTLSPNENGVLRAARELVGGLYLIRSNAA